MEPGDLEWGGAIGTMEGRSEIIHLIYNRSIL